MKDSKILIIGGTGFIGKALVSILKQRGFSDVMAVSRSSHGVDVTDPSTLDKWVFLADYVINLAGLVAFDKKSCNLLMAVNYKGALNVLESCEKSGRVKKLVHVSSTAALGFSPNIIDENFDFDWSKYKNLTYSYSKFLPNKEIAASRLPTNIIYPPLVIGKNDKTNTERLFDYVYRKKRVFVPSGINGIIDVYDLAEGIALILERGNNKENYIVSSENIGFDELFTTITGLLNQKNKIIKLSELFHKPAYYIAGFLEALRLNIPSENVFLGFQRREFNTDKIKELGFEPKHNYKQALEEALKTFQKYT